VLTLIEPDSNKGKLDESHKHNVGFVVSSADSAKSFDSSKEALNDVPFLVFLLIVLPWVSSVGFGWNYRFMSVCLGQSASLISLVSLIHEQRYSFIILADGFYGFLPFGCVVALPA
jgi:hypothetical protein